MENLLLEEATAVGVVKKCPVHTPTNPNKLVKQLAPWFSEGCRAARRAYGTTCRAHGRSSDHAKRAFSAYKGVCREAARVFAATLPDMLKY